MRRMMIALFAASLSASALASDKPATKNQAEPTETATRENERPRLPEGFNRNHPLVRAAEDATRVATPGAIRTANWLKANGVIHKDTVVEAP